MIYTIEFDSAGKAFCPSAYDTAPAKLLANEIVCTEAQFKDYQAYALVNGVIVAAAADAISSVAANAARLQRDALIASSDWIVRRQNDQVAAGTTPTLTAAQYTAWLTYRQALRDITKQSAFPTSVTWPTAPA